MLLVSCSTEVRCDTPNCKSSFSVTIGFRLQPDAHGVSMEKLLATARARGWKITDGCYCPRCSAKS